MNLGIIIVTYNSSKVVIDCLDSISNSRAKNLKVVVIDNASVDETTNLVEAWFQSKGIQDWSAQAVSDDGSGNVVSSERYVLLLSDKNRGFAGGVNVGLRALLNDESISLFWLLNPDCIVEPETAGKYLREAESNRDFGIMGSRILYCDNPGLIQSDGGRVSRLTGICTNVNLGDPADSTTAPDASSLDYVSGANLVASRIFVETVGLMNEDYFLYYEEVDWAFRGQRFPLIVCKDAIVRHHGGTSIGSGAYNRRASGFANFFNYRNRMRFVSRHMKKAIFLSYVFSLLRVIKLMLTGHFAEAEGAFRGLHQLPPPRAVRHRISRNVWGLAFGECKRK